jgi:hypothetical protein
MHEEMTVRDLLTTAREYVQEAFDRKIEALRIDLQIAAVLDAIDTALEGRE